MGGWRVEAIETLKDLRLVNEGEAPIFVFMVDSTYAAAQFNFRAILNRFASCLLPLSSANYLQVYTYQCAARRGKRRC